MARAIVLCDSHTTHRAAVVDEAGQVATLGGIDDGVVVHAEQVTASNALLGISLLTHVSHHLERRRRDIHKRTK